MNQPYLSVVITGRNDDYGSNFLSRLQTFIKSLDHHLDGFSHGAELVLVEWNPPADRPGLGEILAAPKNFPLRIITVPHLVHKEICDERAMLEMHAKNVGIRRCHGEFVLVTNPDIIFSPALINRIASKDLQTNSFYRTDRYDFYGDGIEDQPVASLSDFASSHVFQAHMISHSQDVNPGTPLDQLPKSTAQDLLHTNASGDFMLATKSNFNRMGGLVESTQQRWHLDSCSVLRFHCHGVQQKLMVSPECIFHQHHERSAADVAWDPEMARRLGVTNGGIDWGLAHHKFEEICLKEEHNGT